MYKIHDPEFQTRLTQKLTSYLSKKVNSEISIGHVELKFFLPLTAVDVRKMDLHQPKFDLKKILIDHADLQITKLLRTEPDTSTFPQPDTGVVHINTTPIQLFVDDLQFVDSKFSFDDMN